MKINRLDWDSFFMMHAHLYATRSTCDRGPRQLFNPERSGTGAVLVRNNMIVAGGYNGSAPGCPHCDDVGHLMVDGHCTRTLHSELNALIQCAKVGVSSDGCTMYTTTSPCWDCSKAMIRAGVKRLVFGELYESRYGLSEAAKSLLKECGISLHCLPQKKLSWIVHGKEQSEEQSENIKRALEHPEEYARRLIAQRKREALS